MAINVYCGLQGSGKSYEVVSSVIVPALAKGRRVVTNIDGIDHDAIARYLDKRDGGADLGSIVQVENDRIPQPKFFPASAEADDSVVRAGDLVVIDEAWRFWAADGTRLLPEHMQFFRMHRHYTHPTTHVACDLALITQDIASLHHSVRNVVEMSCRTTKLKTLGMVKTYRLELFEGWKQNRKTRVDVYVKRYDPEIFPLYRSYAATAGTEAAIDRRQNVLNRQKVWLVAVAAVVLSGASLAYLWRFFHPPAKTIGTASKSFALASTQPPVVPPKQHKPASESRIWRIVGQARMPSAYVVILRSTTGQIRLEPAAQFNLAYGTLSGRLNGETVTEYSGGAVRGAP
jgi:zona occludens toxin